MALTERRWIAPLAVVAAVGGAALLVRAQGGGVPDTQKLQQMAARFAPTDIGADVSKLPPADRRVLAKLVEASKIVDSLFLRQVSAGNDAMLLDLVKDQSPSGRARLHYFLINKGPWSRLDHHEPFVPGAPAKPVGANFYPPDASKADVERWMRSLPQAESLTRQLEFFASCRSSGAMAGGWRSPPSTE